MTETQREWSFRELVVPLSMRGHEVELLARELRIPEVQIFNAHIERMGLDARRRGRPHWTCNIRFSTHLDIRHRQLAPARPLEVRPPETFGSKPLRGPVHVVGAGPAGLWAGLHLARNGYKVILHEQGKPVRERFRDIRHFFHQREFHPTSNVLFGEGGAGAFSDGKLNTRTRNGFTLTVLEDFAKAGAGEEVTYLSKPHVGTDRLQFLLVAIRKWIQDAGAEFRFESRLEDIRIESGEITGATFSGKMESVGSLVLATGHSARDIYRLLHARGVQLETKDFAVGVRGEHPQSLVDARQLGRGTDTTLCGHADYSLACPAGPDHRGAYSFCMCPGGVLVPCASEPGGFATNGMSYSRRSAPRANSGLVVPVSIGKGLWDGVDLQSRMETTAFEVGGKNYSAPAQTPRAFLEHRSDRNNLPASSFPTGLVPSNLWDWMPLDVCLGIEAALVDFDHKIPGFIEQGLLVAPETRTSSPLRVPRNPDTLESINTRGLYPLGEGAGYAGGIVTSAADGVRLAWLAGKANP